MESVASRKAADLNEWRFSSRSVQPDQLSTGRYVSEVRKQPLPPFSDCDMYTRCDILGNPVLSFFEPTVNTQWYVRVGPLPAPPRYIAPDFEVIFPCYGVSLSVKRGRGCDELVSGTIRLGDRPVSEA